MWQAYKQELAEYLGRVTKDLQPKPGPRPTGAATRMVFTEYDIPRQGRPISAHTGTIWTEGQSTRYESKGARDIWVDSKGYLWVSDDRSMGRTTGRLDPRTGKWTDYALPNASGVATNSHGIWGDQNDNIYQGGQPDGAILMFDTKKEEFVHFARPDTIPRAGGHIDVDSQGNAWAPADGGALKLDGKTGEYTFYPVPYADGVRASDQNQYGIAVDAQDNVWLARAGSESVAYLEPKTGQTGHVKFEPLVFPGLTEKDRTVAVGMNMGPPNGKGPRRLGAGGRNGGNYMWVALNKSDALARIDIRTKADQGIQPASGQRAVRRDRRQERHGLGPAAERRSDFQSSIRRPSSSPSSSCRLAGPTSGISRWTAPPRQSASGSPTTGRTRSPGCRIARRPPRRRPRGSLRFARRTCGPADAAPTT